MISLESPFLDDGEEMIIPLSRTDLFVEIDDDYELPETIEEESYEYPQGYVSDQEEEEILQSYGMPTLEVLWLDKNKIFLLDYDPNLPIYDLKLQLEEVTRVPMASLHLSRSEREIDEITFDTLIFNNVNNGDRIFIL